MNAFDSKLLDGKTKLHFVGICCRRPQRALRKAL